MKRILFFLLLLPAFSFAQLCADEDTVRANSVTLITYNSARVNGTTGHFAGTVLSISLKYVRVGQTDTATSTSAGVNALRNITGLQANTLYVYYYISTCGSGTVKQSVAYTFTTLANTVNYTPMAAMGYQFKYLKADSGLMAPRRDTTIGRAPNYGGQIVWKPEDSTFYGYNGEYWHPLAIDSAGIISLLNDKVDSVTVAGDSLWYWKSGVSYGYILPTQANEWKLVGNSGTTAGTNFVGTTDNVDLVFKTNNAEVSRWNAAGALGLGAGTDYGTAGYVLKTNGNAASPSWVAPSSLYPTWQQTLTAGSTFTQNNTIRASHLYSLTFDSLTSFIVKSGNGGTNYNSYLELTDASAYMSYTDNTGFRTAEIWAGSDGGNMYSASPTGTGGNYIEQVDGNMSFRSTYLSRSTEMDFYYDSLVLKPYEGNLEIDTLNYSSNADDSMMVWQPSTGHVGMRAIPSGGSGANTALSNLASVAINTSLISDADNTDDLGSTSVSWRTGYFGTTILPDANDGAQIGSTTRQWSDLFLAEGGVINWDNGDATLTQVGNSVTLDGAAFLVTSPSQTPASFSSSFAGNMQVNWNSSTGNNVNFVFQDAGTARWYIGNNSATGSDRLHILNASASEAVTVLQGLQVGINQTAPTARLHIGAGASTASYAPLKFTTGTNNTTAEAGAMEYTTPQLFFTNGRAVRQEIFQGQQARVSTQYDNATTTLGNVTGLTVNVAASGTYRFTAKLFTTSDVGGGIKVAIGGTATATSIRYEGLTTDAGLTTSPRVSF